MKRTGNPLPYLLDPITDAKAGADGRCVACGALQELATMQRDANRGVFGSLYCDDCAAYVGEVTR